MTAVLTTRRCVLRPVAPADAELLHAVWSSPGVRRYLWDAEEIPIERTRDAIEQSRRMFDEHRHGLWGAWRLDEPGTMCGFGGLWPFRDPPDIELLYGVADEYWGKGYAKEIARAVIGYCFEALGMRSVQASTDVANAASVRVLERLGFALVRHATVGGLDTVFYQIDRPIGGSR